MSAFKPAGFFRRELPAGAFGRLFRLSGAAVPVSVVAPSLSVLSGDLGKIGVEIAMSDGIWSIAPGQVEYRWRRNGVGLIDGQAASRFMPTEAADGWEIRGEARVRETDGEWSAWAATAPQAITYYAPVAGRDAWAEHGQTGEQTFNAAALFSVTGDADLSGVTFSLVEPKSYLSISGGVVTLDTARSGSLVGEAVIVRGTNSGGHGDAVIVLTVAGLENTGAPGLSAAAGALGKIGVRIDLSNGTWIPTPDAYEYRWRRNGAGLIGGQTGNALTPSEAMDGWQIRGEVRARLTGGVWSDWIASDYRTISYHAPVASNGTWNETAGTGLRTFDAATLFAVAGDDDLSGISAWNLIGNDRPYISIAGSIVTVDTGASGPISNVAIVVRAVNSDGEGQATITLNVAAAVVVPVAVPTVYLPWMEPVYLRNGTGTWAVDCSERFEGGPVATYSIVGTAPSGVAINPVTGILSIPTTADFAWREVRIRGTNAAGQAEVTIELRVLTPTHTLSGGAAFSTISPSAGSKIWITGGTYTTIQNISGWGGSSSNPTEIFGDLSNRPVFNASALTGDRILTLGNANDLHLRGLDFVDDGGCNQAFYTNTGVRNRFEQLSISGFRRFAFALGYTSKAARNHVIRYCNIFGNTRENRNTNGTGGAMGGGGWGRGIAGDTSGAITIARNWVHENWGEGIGTLGVNGGTIAENLVWDNYSINIYGDNTANVSVTDNIVWSNNSTFYRSGAPAKSILQANEDYGGSAGVYELATTGNVVRGNRILSGNSAPGYDGSYGDGGGAGTSVYTPNTTIASINPKWKIGPTNRPRAA